MRDKVLYELEYQVNELRKAKLSEIEYEDITIKDLLDLGFDNTFIRINKQWFNLGYKWFVVDVATGIEHSGYESSDFGELNDKQLNCMVHYINDEISDYNSLQVSVELVNKEDEKLFLGGEE